MPAKNFVDIQELLIVTEVNEAIHDSFDFPLIRDAIMYHFIDKERILLECRLSKHLYAFDCGFDFVVRFLVVIH
ncbi:MAG: hypothetical protein ACI4TM_03880 [Candidatus Cryptobacteroides sp.]